MARSGPGGGPDGVPAAIALTPILSARYRQVDLERIAAAAPGSRLVSVSLEGLADAPLDDVEVLLRGPLPARVFDRLITRCPGLIWVHSATAGVERVLTAQAETRGLVITNARGVFSTPIAEYVLMMILAVSRRLPQLLELQRERTWQPLEAREMHDVTVGIVGFGSIGRAVAELCLGSGSRVVATRRRGATGDGGSGDVPAGVEVLAADALPELLERSDFVVLALPLTPDTEDLFDERMLARMKPGSWLINVARGRLVDERALVRALREGPMRGAVLDTLRDEPLSPDSPLYDVPNLILTPHTSWTSGRVLDRSIELFCENLERFRRGEPLHNAVDPALGY
ncbi:MAG: D-2-hydroxyacid dehydrogenase [Chloroflexi bacterium]|nr:D-2-hydroxyacid dehydrogenase [Chloroflexota bacterium]